MADGLAKQGSRGVIKVFPALQVPDQSTPLPMSGLIPPSVRHTYKHGGPQPRPPWNGLDSPWFKDGEFANTEPLIPWDTLSSIMVEAAQNVLGRSVPRMGTPYSDEDLHEISEMRKDLALLWSRLQEGSSPAEQQRVKHQHRMLSRQLQRFRSKARSRFVRHLCNEAEQHIRFHDMGRFYKSLKKIGAHLSDHTVSGKVDHDLTALRSHCQAVSGSVQEVSDAVLDHVPWGTVAHWLGHTPSPAEVRLAVRRLRDCSPGRDEVTAGMLRWAGPRAMDCVISIIQSLWVSQPDVWPHSVKQGIGIYLHKKGKCQKHMRSCTGMSSMITGSIGFVFFSVWSLLRCTTARIVELILKLQRRVDDILCSVAKEDSRVYWPSTPGCGMILTMNIFAFELMA